MLEGPETRIERNGEDISAEIDGFEIRTFAVKDNYSLKGYHWESSLKINPPQNTDVTITAIWEGSEYPIWPQAKTSI